MWYDIHRFELCVPLTITKTRTCTGDGDGSWDSYWRGSATKYNEIYTLNNGGYVDTSVATLAKDLKLISSWVKISKYPTFSQTEIVSKSIPGSGFEILLLNTGFVRTYLMSNSAGVHATGTTIALKKYTSSYSAILIGEWVHIVATHDSITQPSTFATFGGKYKSSPQSEMTNDRWTVSCTHCGDISCNINALCFLNVKLTCEH